MSTTLPITTSSSATNLPEGWRMVRFGDVVRNLDVYVSNPLEAGLERYIGLDHLEPESLHIKRWGLIADGTSFTRKFTKGQVLFGKRRAYQRKAAVADFDGICSGDILVFEPQGDDLLPDLLPFIVQSEGFYNHALGTSAGSLSPRTRWRDLAQYEFPLPPKDEQRRIADILWAADDALTKTQAVQPEFHSYKLALLQKLFDQDNPVANGSVEVSPLGGLLSYASDGPFGSKLKTEHYADTGARVIRLQNVGDETFDDSDKAYISLSYYKELIRYAVHPADIIIAGLGDETHQVGRACQIPEDFGLAVNKADCFCLRAKPAKVEQAYLMYFLNSPYARQQVLQLAQGTTRLRINVSNLKTLLVPVPNRDMQVSTIGTLDSLEQARLDLLRSIQAKQAMLKALREHLLASKE